MKKTTSTQVFIPQMDWWVAGLVLLVLLAFLGSEVLVARQALSWYLKVPALLVLLASILYLLDTAFFTRYQLEENGLAITSQLRHFFFPYRHMRKITPTGILALFSTAKRKRFALSTHSISIQLSQGDWPQISLSPKADNQFLSQLLEHIDTERSTRTAHQ